MNHKFALLAALVAGLLPVAGSSQVSPAATQPATTAPQAAPATPAPAPAASATPPAAQPTQIVPQAYPAKIALIAFEQAVIATNEGQRTLAEVQKKYEPKKAQIDALAVEVDSLKKQLQAAPATLPDEERAARLKSIDAKDKQYQRDVDDASTAYNADLQEAYGKVAQKVNLVLRNYVEKNGYTLLLDVSNQQSPVMWAAHDPNADVTEAVILAYNASSGISAPPPSAPSATRPRPSTTTPRATTPKPPVK